jgi:hypothetical protein
MPQFPDVFPLWWIALTALVTFLSGFGILRWKFKAFTAIEAFLVAIVAGLAVFSWRVAGNIKELNDDPLPPFSPNDLLCPMAVYVLLGVYSGLRPSVSALKGWEQVRALLTIIALVVNVVVI